jgi:hypothetical protein
MFKIFRRLQHQYYGILDLIPIDPNEDTIRKVNLDKNHKTQNRLWLLS